MISVWVDQGRLARGTWISLSTILILLTVRARSSTPSGPQSTARVDTFDSLKVAAGRAASKGRLHLLASNVAQFKRTLCEGRKVILGNGHARFGIVYEYTRRDRGGRQAIRVGQMRDVGKLAAGGKFPDIHYAFSDFSTARYAFIQMQPWGFFEAKDVRTFNMVMGRTRDSFFMATSDDIRGAELLRFLNSLGAKRIYDELMRP